ncbi:hydantoinase B/oxoprolinase family protein [Agrobacterium sp. NPDC090283]|uniref:hydantoinase B/oxoprolinase family protein n=1 Tax=Agrobacterium sp. NPDC090283 TaxID=3363920 RepID=UPI00383AFA0A
MNALSQTRAALDPVTFEVLNNAFISAVNQMAEQVIKTCHSFVVFNRDFSCTTHDAEGNLLAVGNQDLAGHIGTMPFTCKAVIDVFAGDIHDGDVFIVNDPYIGGTHVCDTRIIRPIFAGGKLIAWAQANGHWTDVGGPMPGSMNVNATDMFAEGLRIPPTRIWHKGRFLQDVANFVAQNTRAPADIIGDIRAQAEATRVAEREMTRLVEKYSRETVEQAIQEVQDYVERSLRQRLADIPDGEWSAVDYFDRDPSTNADGMIPVKLKMTKRGTTLVYDFTGTNPCLNTLFNMGFGASISGVIGAMKTFFPDLPLNGGFYRVTEFIQPEGTMINAQWPVATQGYVMVLQKIYQATSEIWSAVLPDLARGCAFAMEFLLSGGIDNNTADRKSFLYYDWIAGGWGGRNGLDGANVYTFTAGAGLAIQQVEPQERLLPLIVVNSEIQTDSGGPGKWRGGVGLVKSSRWTEIDQVRMSFIHDRERAVPWGINGGLPGSPAGLTIVRNGSEDVEWFGTNISGIEVATGDLISRPSGGGGGQGDPLERDPEAVLEDVIDDYVSIERARKDYGVVIRPVDPDICEYELDLEATKAERESQRRTRLEKLATDPETVAAMYRSGEIDALDVVRHYACVLDWRDGSLLPKSTVTYREHYRRCCVDHWAAA